MTSELLDVRLEQASREDWAASAGPEWRDAQVVHSHLARDTYLFEAADLVPWGSLLEGNTTVLDLGCGSGWLTGRLSADHRVAKIIAWDASPALLRDVLPEMVSLIGGDQSKVERVCGTFTPILLNTGSVDLAVMSSAFHHCDRPDALLTELIRVVRPGGHIGLLNEVPYSRARMVLSAGKMAVAASVNSLTARITIAKPGYVASDHVLYDEELGDRALTPTQWRRLFSGHGLVVETVDTGLPSYRPAFRRRGRWEGSLTHFILTRA